MLAVGVGVAPGSEVAEPVAVGVASGDALAAGSADGVGVAVAGPEGTTFGGVGDSAGSAKATLKPSAHTATPARSMARRMRDSVVRGDIFLRAPRTRGSFTLVRPSHSVGHPRVMPA
jgi:hypothetical protein